MSTESATPNEKSTDANERANHIPHIIREWANAYSTANVEAFVALFTEDATLDDIPFGVIQGRDQLRGFAAAVFAAVPDYKMQVVAAYDAAGNRLVAQWVQTGTVVAPLGKVVPTGKSIMVRGMSLFELRGNLIAVETDYWDLQTVIEQLG